MATRASHRVSRKTAWLSVTFAGSVLLSVAAGLSVWRHSAILGVPFILASSILGVAIARSMGHRTVSASTLGGAAGCAVLVGVTFFFEIWLIPPEPGTVYKFGGGVESAIAGLLGGLFIGGLWGSIVGLVAGLFRKIP
jgi:hypothetical protein